MVTSELKHEIIISQYEKLYYKIKFYSTTEAILQDKHTTA